MDSGIWIPLDYNRRQIRLAHLAPSTNLEQPSCSLQIVSLDENPQYDALSYVWGDPSVTAPIRLQSMCDATPIDADGLQPPVTDIVTAGYNPRLPPSAMNKIYNVEWPVTTNLEAALRYLRHESMVRILWIDAICIYQSDLEERNHQVPLMKSIYSNAATVRIWLGTPVPGSDEAMTIIREIGKGVPLEDINLQGRLVTDNNIRSISELVTRPWWDRTWVQQELLLAKRATFYCGFESLMWSDMPNLGRVLSWVRSAMKSLQLDGYIFYTMHESLNSFVRIQVMAEVHENSPTSETLIFLLARGRLCHSSDEHDSIYGFLGLMNNDIASRIMPDYNMSVADLFRDVAVQLTLCSQSLILFSLTQYTTKQDRELPTWAPSWRALSGVEDVKEWSNRLNRLEQQQFYSACAEHNIKFEIVDRTTVKLSGTRLDHIVRKSSIRLSANAKTNAILRQQREWHLLCDLENDDQSHYIAGGMASDAFWRILVNDIYVPLGEMGRRCETEDYKAYQEWLHELEDFTASYWKSELVDAFHYSYLEACLGRLFLSLRRATSE